MKSKLVLIFLGILVATQCKKPPWYRPCWIYLCGMDLTDPVCAWDSHHGARLFRNDCEMDRHNFCYKRNYALIEGNNNVEEDIKLCAKLKVMVDRAVKKPSVLQDGNIKVHFIMDPNALKKPDKSLSLEFSQDNRQKKLPRRHNLERHNGRHRDRALRVNDRFDMDTDSTSYDS